MSLPDDMARVRIFLVFPAARYLTGAVNPDDGGNTGRITRWQKGM
jgi:hypothetical protein